MRTFRGQDAPHGPGTAQERLVTQRRTDRRLNEDGGAHGWIRHEIVAITDNLSTRTTQEVTDWLDAHPRWRFQFTPKHASWLNQVEIFFSILARRLLKNGIFTSESDLAEQMLAFIETYNQTARPFKWTYTGKVLEA